MPMRKPQTTCALLQVVRHCTKWRHGVCPEALAAEPGLPDSSHSELYPPNPIKPYTMLSAFFLLPFTIFYALLGDSCFQSCCHIFYLKLFSQGSFLPMITNKRVWEQGSTQRLTCSMSSSSDPCQSLRMAFSLQFLEGELVLHTDGLSDRQMAAASKGVF